MKMFVRSAHALQNARSEVRFFRDPFRLHKVQKVFCRVFTEPIHCNLALIQSSQ